MGTNTLSTRADGNIVGADDVNQYKSAFNGNIVPRNSSGVATANAGEMGTSSIPFIRANITTGYLYPGVVIMFHDFNATLTPGQGWMKCNGDIVNSTNYDAIHGTNSWTTYITTSPLSGLYLPDMTSAFAKGSNATSQDGTSAITTTGNSGHSITISNHTHTMNLQHNHRWYDFRTTSIGAKSYTSAGADQDLDSTSACDIGAIGLLHDEITVTNDPLISADLWTNNQLSTTETSSSNGGFTQDIQPESHVFQFWMRII